MICDKEKCTGCFACYNICHCNSITMQEDEIGNIYPKIDLNTCTECGACKKVCPQLNKVEFSEPKKAYAMYNSNEKLRAESTSGGAATTFYMHVLSKNGVVYGCNNIENNEIKFIRVTNKEELHKLKGSKYVHGYIKDVFKLIREDLKDDKLVLFVGTPCQVAGLKKFLGVEYPKLILVDLICHGVPTQKLLIEEINSHNIENITKVTFREDNGFKFKLYTGCDNVLTQEINENAYYQGFMDSIFYRPNCYKCEYATSKRVSDITIGDFWGLSTESKLYDKNKEGVSVLLPITQKGIELIEECKFKMILEERPIREAIEGNSQLRNPSIKTKKYKMFKVAYIKYGYNKACNTFMWKNKFKIKLKNNKYIYKLYKKIKRKN